MSPAVVAFKNLSNANNYVCIYGGRLGLNRSICSHSNSRIAHGFPVIIWWQVLHERRSLTSSLFPCCSAHNWTLSCLNHCYRQDMITEIEFIHSPSCHKHWHKYLTAIAGLAQVHFLLFIVHCTSIAVRRRKKNGYSNEQGDHVHCNIKNDVWKMGSTIWSFLAWKNCDQTVFIFYGLITKFCS